MLQSACQSRDELLGEAANAFFEALGRGEQPAIDDYAERYPEIAEDVRRVFPALALVGESTASGGLGSPLALENAQQPLGDFRIVRELGRGGMGVVYEAEQLSIGRRVALKVLPFAAMLDRQQLNRFKNEARAAGTLDHPNIVAVHSVGTERGVHYYAMQLVEGHSLAQVIAQLPAKSDASSQRSVATSNGAPSIEQPAGGPDTLPVAHLSTLPAPCSSLPAFTSREYYRTVASLGIQAAEALDHAHQNGILHRDIKPANLLLDESGKLWITDFGLARIEADAGMTMTGDMLGTLRYMSPEQALAKRAVVDHRSDIYSLGITLYELLVLRPAFGESDRQELLRQIAYEEPRAPRQVNRHIPVDLETILLKAMEKEPADRYATAQELADDLRRFLEDMPISARRPTVGQRVVRWSRRHFATVAAVAGIFALLALASFVGAWLIWDEQAKTAEALERAEQHAAIAEQNAAEAEAVVNFLVADLINAAGPAKKQGRDLTVEEVLEQAEKRAGRRFADQPLIEARIRMTLGEVFRDLGRYDIAEQQFLHARELRHRLLGPASDETLDTSVSLADILRLQGRLSEAQELAESALTSCRQLFGEEHDLTWHAARVLACVLYDDGKYANAKALYELERDYLRRKHGPDSRQTLIAEGNLASALYQLGDIAAAAESYRRCLVIQSREAGARDPQTLVYQYNLVLTLRNLGRFDEALALAEELVKLSRETLGPQHRQTLRRMGTFAALLHSVGEYQKACEVSEESLNIMRRTLKAADPNLPQAMLTLAQNLLSKGDLNEARKLCVESLELRETYLRLDHPDIYKSIYQLAKVLHEQGHYEKALELHQKTWEFRQRVYGPEHPYTLDSMSEVAKSLWAHGQLGAARQLYERALTLSREVEGERSASLVSPLEGLARVRREEGQYEASAALLRECLDIWRQVLPATHPAIRKTMNELADVLCLDGDIEEVDRLLASSELSQHLEVADYRREKSLSSEADVEPAWLGDYYAIRGEYSEAAQQYDLAIQRDPADHWSWYNAAPLYLYLGDTSSYQRICGEFLANFRGTDDPAIAERIAKTCSLAPNAVADVDAVHQLAEMAVTNGADHGAIDWFYLAKALAEYRGGHFESAIQSTDRCLADDEKLYLYATGLLVKAMALHQLGRAEEARTLLDEVHRLTVRYSHIFGGVSLDKGWHDWLRFEILRREASSLLGNEPLAADQ